MDFRIVLARPDPVFRGVKLSYLARLSSAHDELEYFTAQLGSAQLIYYMSLQT